MSQLAACSGLVLGVLLLATAGSKLRDVRWFREKIADYAIVPYALTSVVAVGVVTWELAAGVLLLYPSTRQVGGVLASLLLGSFLCTLGIALKHGRRISCGCFGAKGDQELIGAQSLARTTSFAILALISAVVESESDWNMAFVTELVLLPLAIFVLGDLVRVIEMNRARMTGGR